MTVERDDRLVSQLRADFQMRWEPNFAAGNAVSTLLLATGLRGLWTMGSVNAVPQIMDQSGLGKTLTYNGNPSFSYSGLAPMVTLDGAGDYLSRATEADLDVIGTEAFIRVPGLTCGAWIRPTNFTATRGVLGKYTSGGNIQYLIRNTATGIPGLIVSQNGVAGVSVNSSNTLALNTWAFVCGRYLPGTELAFWYNRQKDVNTTAIPANLFAGVAPFIIGAYNAGGAGLFIGDISMCFLVGSALPDYTIMNIYEQSRAMYGV